MLERWEAQAPRADYFHQLRPDGHTPATDGGKFGHGFLREVGERVGEQEKGVDVDEVFAESSASAEQNSLSSNPT